MPFATFPKSFINGFLKIIIKATPPIIRSQKAYVCAKFTNIPKPTNERTKEIIAKTATVIINPIAILFYFFYLRD